MSGVSILLVKERWIGRRMGIAGLRRVRVMRPQIIMLRAKTTGRCRKRRINVRVCLAIFSPVVYDISRFTYMFS